MSLKSKVKTGTTVNVEQARSLRLGGTNRLRRSLAGATATIGRLSI
jgi:hypothetical protein